MIPNKMLCCSGEKESAREMKSAQNTPSRQPLHMPYTAGTGVGGQQQPHHPHHMGPPPLTQQMGPLGTRLPPPLAPGTAAAVHHANQGMMNNFDQHGGHHLKDDYRKVHLSILHHIMMGRMLCTIKPLVKSKMTSSKMLIRPVTFM